MATIRVTGKLTNGRPFKAVRVEAKDALHAATPFAELVATSGQLVDFDTVSYKRMHVKAQKLEILDAPKPSEPKKAEPAKVNGGKK